MRNSILFLGFNRNETSLVNFLESKGCKVNCTKEKIEKTQEFNLIISFGYRHIISNEILFNSKVPIINLHISYLPWNKGAHPNFWSFYESTPSGVSIHLMDSGIDTGPILFQKYVNFNSKENTFEKTYKRLLLEIEELFMKNFENILKGNYKPFPQKGVGTYHRKSDLPKGFRGWDSLIADEIKRLGKIKYKTKGII